MRKVAVIAYLVITIGLMLTAAAWFTWGNACQYISLLPEGSSYRGICVGNGVQFVGIFGFCVLIALVYVSLTAIIFKLFGCKLTKK